MAVKPLGRQGAARDQLRMPTFLLARVHDRSTQARSSRPRTGLVRVPRKSQIRESPGTAVSIHGREQHERHAHQRRITPQLQGQPAGRRRRHLIVGDHEVIRHAFCDRVLEHRQDLTCVARALNHVTGRQQLSAQHPALVSLPSTNQNAAASAVRQ